MTVLIPIMEGQADHRAGRVLLEGDTRVDRLDEEFSLALGVKRCPADSGGLAMSPLGDAITVIV